MTDEVRQPVAEDALRQSGPAAPRACGPDGAAAHDGVSGSFPGSPTFRLIYHFCRLRLPEVQLAPAVFARYLQKAFGLHEEKHRAEGVASSWPDFLEGLHTLDAFIACACLEGEPAAWECLFASRASRTDTLLVDALRARAVRLFPRDLDRQEEAVAEFWGYLLAGQRPGTLPILARYDGQRPLIPWLLRVFQNKHLSDLRQRSDVLPLPSLDLGEPVPADSEHERWYDELRLAARDWMDALTDTEVLILGLRLRYRLSQREVATLLGIHEGNVSRKVTRLRDGCFEQIGRHLEQLGWLGDDLGAFLYKEMDSLLLDEPRLSADRLAALLAARGQRAPRPGRSKRQPAPPTRSAANREVAEE